MLDFLKSRFMKINDKVEKTPYLAMLEKVKRIPRSAPSSGSTIGGKKWTPMPGRALRSCPLLLSVSKWWMHSLNQLSLNIVSGFCLIYGGTTWFVLNYVNVALNVLLIRVQTSGSSTKHCLIVQIACTYWKAKSDVTEKILTRVQLDLMKHSFNVDPNWHG